MLSLHNEGSSAASRAAGWSQAVPPGGTVLPVSRGLRGGVPPLTWQRMVVLG